MRGKTREKNTRKMYSLKNVFVYNSNFDFLVKINFFLLIFFVPYHSVIVFRHHCFPFLHGTVDLPAPLDNGE